MKEELKASFTYGMQKSLPLVFSASFFGLIFGFTGASGGLDLSIVSSMSFIIFAGSAQFITLVLINQGEQLIAVIVAAIILNLRHLLYGAVLHDILTFKGIRRLIPAYFLTDEAFLVTTIANKEQEEDEIDLVADWVLIGAGLTLWIFWNISTILGFLIFSLSSNFLMLPDNFVISASFVGFLVEHWVKYPADRLIIIITSILSISLGSLVSSSIMLISVMLGGALSAIIIQMWRNSRD